MLFALVSFPFICLLALGAPTSEASGTTVVVSHYVTQFLELGRRQIEAHDSDVQVAFITVTEEALMRVTKTEVEVVTIETSPTVMPFLVVPPFQTLAESTTGPIQVPTTTRTVTVPTTVVTTLTEPPEMVTITVPATTVTRTITTPQQRTSPTSTYWTSPSQYWDLDSFNIKNFATGEDNLEIVDEVPKWAGGPDADDRKHSIIQVSYPKGSINPGNDDAPVGGAGFYATPLPLADAMNVTLEYSVFFPLGFDWVLAGKLPGLYGGHMTCSGGDDADMCFSTRMMWRSQGAGELYLYAPKDKQTDALCRTPPESHCNAQYGLSIGRGSFYFKRGGWTRIRQTVRLNTPGKQDGGFELEVNDRFIMRRDDIYYRKDPNAPKLSSDDDRATGGVLGPLLGGILHVIGSWRISSQNRTPTNTNIALRGQPFLVFPPTSWTAQNSSWTTLALFTTLPAASNTETLSNFRVQFPNAKAIGFSGLFFSTFFGGNSEEYASPDDQSTWFKDFSITVNG